MYNISNMQTSMRLGGGRVDERYFVEDFNQRKHIKNFLSIYKRTICRFKPFFSRFIQIWRAQCLCILQIFLPRDRYVRWGLSYQRGNWFGLFKSVWEKHDNNFIRSCQRFRKRLGNVFCLNICKEGVV